MTAYNVTWEIEVDASSPREAAKVALQIQRDPNSEATVFEVRNSESPLFKLYEIDLHNEVN